MLRCGNVNLKFRPSFSLDHLQPQTKHPGFRADLPPNKYLRRPALDPATAVPSRLRILLPLTGQFEHLYARFWKHRQLTSSTCATGNGQGFANSARRWTWWRRVVRQRAWNNNEHGKWLQWGRDVRYPICGCKEAKEQEVQSLSSTTSNDSQKPNTFRPYVSSVSNISAASAIASSFTRRLSAQPPAPLHLTSRGTKILHHGSTAITESPQEAL